MSLMMVTRRRGGAALTEVVPYAFPTSAPYNVPDHMDIPTYDGSGQQVHWDVIDFAAQWGAPWQGWRYWAVMTPYPGFNDAYEDPSLLVSNDAYNWQVPPGLTNPVYEWTAAGYHNDPDLVWDPAAAELVMMWRTPANNYAPVVARSSDGITWPAVPSVIDITPMAGYGLSPSLVRDADGTWHMWQVSNDTRLVHHWTAAAPEGPWGAATICTGTPTSIWHTNVVAAPGGGYHMLSAVNKNSAYGICSSSADGTAWTSSAVKVLNIGTGNWDNDDMYRPGLALHESGDRYRVWYSGLASNVWRAGYTQVPISEWPPIP